MTPILSYLDGSYPVYFYREEYSTLIPSVPKEVHVSITGDGYCHKVLCSNCPCAFDDSCGIDEILPMIHRLIPSAVNEFPELFL